MKNRLGRTAVLLSLALCSGLACSGLAFAQNTPTPKAEDAEQNAFQTPTTGKKETTGSAGKANSADTHSGMNPESRLNDDPPANEKVGAPNTPGK